MSLFLSLIAIGSLIIGGNSPSNSTGQNITSEKNTCEIPITNNPDIKEKIEKTYAFNPQGKIEVLNINGSIFLEAWDRAEIQLTATKSASTAERLKELHVEIEDSLENFRIKINYKKDRRSRIKRYNYSKQFVTIRLKVPNGAFLNGIETVNGSVKVSNMTNYTEIATVNGSIKATNLQGTAKLSTVNGTVYADFNKLDETSRIFLETVNGSVKLGLLSDADATIKADTVNGRISNEFGLPIRVGKYVGRNLYGKIGKGFARIKLTSVNGGIFINNKNGGATKPTVNLLKRNTSDDFDESFKDNEKN